MPYAHQQDPHRIQTFHSFKTLMQQLQVPFVIISCALPVLRANFCLLFPDVSLSPHPGRFWGISGFILNFFILGERLRGPQVPLHLQGKFGLSWRTARGCPWFDKLQPHSALHLRHPWQPFLISSLLLSLREFLLTFSRLQVIQDGTTLLHSCW